jgi:hypothetical protein
MPRRTLIQQSRAISSQRKAQWHEDEGAGKSHVRRPFFGLNREDEEALTKRLDDYLDRTVRET